MWALIDSNQMSCVTLLVIWVLVFNYYAFLSNVTERLGSEWGSHRQESFCMPAAER